MVILLIENMCFACAQKASLLLVCLPVNPMRRMEAVSEPRLTAANFSAVSY